MNSPIALEYREPAEATERKHCPGLVTQVFTDLVHSVALRRNSGDQAGTSVLQAHL